MLCDLYIRDFVIARKLHLEFTSGLSVLTGETGAGKSILVGALGLVLGDRADSQTVRTGTDKSEISAIFDISANTTAQAWLAAHDLDSDGECVIRRVVLASGRSRAFINGKPATLQQLKQLGHQLVDIHGQHEHQAMMRGAVQRQWLDAFAAHPQLLAEVAQHFDSWDVLRRKFADFKQTLSERSARIDLLRFQTEEISKLAIVEGEAASLSAEQYRLSHVATLAESGEAALLDLMADDTGTLASLARARRALGHITSIDPELSEYDELLDGADIQITEAVSGLQRYLKALDMDPARRDFVEQRLDSISGLAKKHRVEPDDLLRHWQTMQDELMTLDRAEQTLEEMEQALEDAASAYRASATKLTRARRAAAKKMSGAITSLVRELGMPESEFGIEITPLADRVWRREGADQV
ncbi:MAG: AAA family ATPase, partial [Gammaproteobacteria bacterium]|nr:AAA family ATPase [Gammaproteobacteria bacterium]